jgi:HEPN domain-containing protein
MEEIGGRELNESARYTVEVPEEMLRCLLEDCYPQERYPTVQTVQDALLRAAEDRCTAERASAHIDLRQLLVELDQGPEARGGDRGGN